MSTSKRDGEAFARLRAADPAADLTPDHESLRHAVTARAGVEDELTARRRRTPRAFQVAAASAGALAIGVSGFALGGGFATSMVASPANGDAGGALPPISLGGGAASDSVASANAEMATEGASPSMGMGTGMDGSERAMGGGADMAYMSWSAGRTVFSQSGLSTSGGTAVAYGYDAKSVVNEQTVLELAKALGVEGDVRDDDGFFMVGTYESGEPNLSVYSDGLASFNYYDPSTDPWKCDSEGDGECTERDLGDAVQGDDAIDAATEVLVTLGLDPASFELEASDPESYGSTDYSNVTAYLVVDGQRTGDQWGLSFTGAGTQSVWGSLANLVELGEYDVVSPAEAVERLSDPRFGASNQVYPLGWMGPAMTREAAPRSGAPSVPAPGTSFDWPVENVTIVTERLGLAQHHLGDGSVVLVPTYELGAEDGRTWSVIAVADAHLDFS